MRILILVLVTVVTLSSAIAASPGPAEAESAIVVTPTAYKNIFVFKVNKKFMGGQLEVLSVNGDCVTCQNLTRRKMTLTLGDALPGTYIVRIQKGGLTEKLQFVRK